MKIERFEDIEAWQLSRELTRKVYRLTKKPEFARDYGLKRQIQYASVHGFINYLKKYEERKATNREP
ncbi:MAG: four helix bundle protein [Deltaproteobacteria bacterium]|nr:four helix bundle protein [Deltaproteobacteria bacterium]